MGRKSLPGLAGAEGRLGRQAAGDPPLASASEPGCLLSVWKVGFFLTLQHQIFFFFFNFLATGKTKFSDDINAFKNTIVLRSSVNRSRFFNTDVFVP